MFDLLAGLKVIDLTTIVLGPYATQILGDFGAEIIKVESCEGDLFRAVRPGRRDDLGVGFQNFNRNKRSVALNLKTDEARELLYQLVVDADVVVHNMRSRSAAELGISYKILKQHNPDLVYCYAPGFGDGGPSENDPAYDDIIQARSGLAALNADADGRPRFVRSIVCDKVVGLHLAIAILTGVTHQQKTGEGTCIEAPMLESMTTFLMAEHLAGHSLVPAEGELGYSRLMSEHRQPYRTTDGYIAILPYSTRHWQRFFEVCGADELVDDPRITDPVRRSEHVDELYARISHYAVQRSTAEWLELLKERDIPCAAVNRLDQLSDDPQLIASGLFENLEDPLIGQIRQLRSPFRVHQPEASKAAGHPSADTRAPTLGEHTREALADIGLSDEQIETLHSAGIINTAQGDSP
jgi:crotonobetainyl-CoA:carnitine CoA-transferase CaiB-like acyl-CoA transferase